MAGRLLVLGLVAISVALLVSPAKGWVGNGYNVASVADLSDGSGIEAILTPISAGNTYGQDIAFLAVTARYETENLVHVHITDANSTRWEIPQSLIPRTNASDSVPVFPTPTLKFSYSSQPFGFAITRACTGEVLFNSTPGPDNLFGPLVFKDQYLELSTQLPQNSSLFGLGESTRPDGLLLTPGRTYTLWNMDTPATNVDVDLYGSYPYYMDVREGGDTHSVLLLNSNGMDIYYNGSFLTFKPVGGVLDVYFFAGPSPAEVLDQYTGLIGRPAPMPYWSLGFHQCKYGYKNLQELQNVVGNYSAASIPLDTMWSDIDHMDSFMDFTFDPVNYPQPQMQAFLEQLHANGQKFVFIVDPGIHVNQSYGTFVRGMQADIFIKTPAGDPFLGQVWPGAVYFPDFLHPQIQPYWTGEITRFQQLAPFDGLWIDMNEVANFCNGTSCTIEPSPGPSTTTCFLSCGPAGQSKWDNPPYWINAANGPAPLMTRTIAVDAVHAGGQVEYNTHNLFGFTEAIATNRALAAARPGKRPFVLARSTFVGSGTYTAHWTGDNGATWPDLGYSVVTILNSGLFGVPMVGADICGFQYDTTEELCGRWIQLGAFYPFARNHAGFSSLPHELYRWDSVANISRAVLGMRYQLLPYLYTLVYEAHTTGGPMARPLFYEYPQDAATLTVNTQYLLGSSLLVSPVLVEGATQVGAYFPQGVWYNMFDYGQVMNMSGGGANQTVAADFYTMNVHVAAGAVVPMQEPGLTTGQVRNSSFTLLVAFSGAGQDDVASGQLYLDDGEELPMGLLSPSSTFVTFQGSSGGLHGALSSNVTDGAYAAGQGWKLQTVLMLGMPAAPTALNIGSAPAPPSVSITQDPVSKVVSFSGLNLSIAQNFSLSW